MTTPATQDAFELQAAMLLEMIVVTFEQAYSLGVCGMSLEAVLIDYDIQVAASTQDEAISACARTVIKAAHNAALRHIPFAIALACLMRAVDGYVHDLLHPQQPTQ